MKVPLECPEEQMVSSIYAEKGDLNQREEVLTRQVRYTVHPRKKSNQTNAKGKKPNTTASGAPYMGKSCDMGTFTSAVAPPVQTSAGVCWCTSAVLRSEKCHRMTHQVAFLSF